MGWLSGCMHWPAADRMKRCKVRSCANTAGMPNGTDLRMVSAGGSASSPAENDGWELRPQNGWNILKIIEICWIFSRPGPSWPQRKNWTQHAIMTCVPGALDACGLELNQPKENHATIAKQQRLLSCVSCTCNYTIYIHIPYTCLIWSKSDLE